MSEQYPEREEIETTDILWIVKGFNKDKLIMQKNSVAVKASICQYH
jgi:hypothetical protein